MVGDISTAYLNVVYRSKSCFPILILMKMKSMNLSLRALCEFCETLERLIADRWIYEKYASPLSSEGKKRAQIFMENMEKLR